MYLIKVHVNMRLINGFIFFPPNVKLIFKLYLEQRTKNFLHNLVIELKVNSNHKGTNHVNNGIA